MQADASIGNAVRTALPKGPAPWADDGVRREAEDEPGCPYADSVMDEYHPDYNPDGVITLAYAGALGAVACCLRAHGARAVTGTQGLRGHGLTAVCHACPTPPQKTCCCGI